MILAKKDQVIKLELFHLCVFSSKKPKMWPSASASRYNTVMRRTVLFSSVTESEENGMECWFSTRPPFPVLCTVEPRLFTPWGRITWLWPKKWKRSAGMVVDGSDAWSIGVQSSCRHCYCCRISKSSCQDLIKTSILKHFANKNCAFLPSLLNGSYIQIYMFTPLKDQGN